MAQSGQSSQSNNLQGEFRIQTKAMDNSRRAHMERGNCRGLILKYDQEIKRIFA